MIWTSEASNLIIETNLINYLNQEFLIFARNFLLKPGTSCQNQELPVKTRSFLVRTRNKARSSWLSQEGQKS